MEAIVGGLCALVLGQFSLLWWRIGKLEGKLDRMNNKDNPGNKGKRKPK